GAVLVLRHRPAARWVAAAVALQMASLMTVFITERYRLAAAPGLLLLGCAGIWETAAALRARRLLPVAAYATALAAAVTFVYWPPSDPSLRVLDDYNASLADLRADRVDAALARLQKVLALQPANAEANFAAGNAWLAKGDRDRAKFYYRHTLQLEPTHERVLHNLGVLALEENRHEMAEQFLLRSLARRPDDAATLYLLARAHTECGHLPDARIAIAHALQLEPGRPDYVALRDQIAAAEPVSSAIH
ncbi:MAG: tetratricopeptide repeat protein, partial [Verrucomicrobia bacterium]|nr:tetratricopeptide repeat protein [Verrucomicrobiota bacterium]